MVQYEAVVLECQLASSTGGGGGHLVIQMDNEEWVGYIESNSTVPSLPPPHPHITIYRIEWTLLSSISIFLNATKKIRLGI